MLSAFVDGEASKFETRLSVKEIVSDPEMRARWERYHLIGDVLRRDAPLIVDKDFCVKVMERIEATPVEEMASVEGETRTVRTWHSVSKPIGALALAASVAVVTVLGLKELTSPNVNVPDASPSVVQKTPPPMVAGVQNVQGPLQSSNPQAKARINSYLVNHTEHASTRGIMPHVRLVGYDMNQK